MVPAKRPTDSILGHFRQVHGQLLEHVHYIYLIDLSRLFFDDSLCSWGEKPGPTATVK